MRIIKTGVPEAEQPVVRAFLSVDAEDEETAFVGKAYLPLARIMSRRDYQRQVVERAERELHRWQTRYEDLSSYFAGVFKAIDNLPKVHKREIAKAK